MVWLNGLTTVLSVAGKMLTRNDDSATVNGTEKVIDFFREKLLSGALKPGDRLLGERELSAQLNISRPALREALRALAMLGFLDIQHGLGTFVRAADISILRNFFTFSLAQHGDVLDDVMEARIAIECQAIRLTCERAGDADLSRLQRYLDDIMATLDDPEAGGKADYLFHLEIVRCSRSQVLLSIYEAIADLLVRSHAERRRSVLSGSGVARYLVDAHREVFTSIVSRDGDQAERKLREHFAIGAEYRRQKILKAYQPEGEGKETLS